ncbi:Ribokinase, partial [Frankliniella fusca]
VSVWFEPTDIHKAAKPLQSNIWKTIDFVSPNFNELRVMCNAAELGTYGTVDANDLPDEDVIRESKELAVSLGEHVRTVIATLGHRGIVLCRRGDADEPFFEVSGGNRAKRLPHQIAKPLEARYYPAPLCRPVSVSGAGDCWNAGFISAALLGKSEKDCVEAGFNAALCSLAATSAVPSDLKTRQTKLRN